MGDKREKAFLPELIIIDNVEATISPSVGDRDMLDDTINVILSEGEDPTLADAKWNRKSLGSESRLMTSKMAYRRLNEAIHEMSPTGGLGCTLYPLTLKKRGNGLFTKLQKLSDNSSMPKGTMIDSGCCSKMEHNKILIERETMKWISK